MGLPFPPGQSLCSWRRSLLFFRASGRRRWKAERSWHPGTGESRPMAESANEPQGDSPEDKPSARAAELATTCHVRGVPASCAEQPLSVIGGFEILGELGRGGMGVVYRARDPRLGREVALKVLPTCAAADRDALARFQREARLASALNHPHVCTIHDLGEHRRPAVLRHGTGSGPHAASAARREAVSGGGDPAGQARRPGPWQRLTRRGLSIGTSSPKTSWSAPMATSRSSTLGWPALSSSKRLRRIKPRTSPVRGPSWARCVTSRPNRHAAKSWTAKRRLLAGTRPVRVARRPASVPGRFPAGSDARHPFASSSAGCHG